MTQWLPHSNMSARFEARARGLGHGAQWREERGIYAASACHGEEGSSKTTAPVDGTLMRAEARAPFAGGSNASIDQTATDSLTLLRLGFATAALRCFSSSPA